MLTVAILNYNGLDILDRCIQSVFRQSRQPDEIIVIDNNSSDGSYHVAERYRCRVVHADNKHKFITGLNTAMELNRGLLFFMQNDVILDRNCLEIMMQDKPERKFIAQPVIYQTDGKIDNSGMDYYWPGYGLRRHTRWWNGFPYEPCGLVTTICFLTDLKGIYYDTRFSPAYYEDIDFYLRTRDNVQHVLIPSATAVHEGNHTFSETYKKYQISQICRRNRRKLIEKHYRGLDLWLRLTVTACLDIMKEAMDVISNGWISPDKFK